jgi:hypothetical protein
MMMENERSMNEHLRHATSAPIDARRAQLAKILLGSFNAYLTMCGYDNVRKLPIENMAAADDPNAIASKVKYLVLGWPTGIAFRPHNLRQSELDDVFDQVNVNAIKFEVKRRLRTDFVALADEDA